jgi:isoleucyl-tRNA synthetase
MDNPYVTYHNDFIESEWWALKGDLEEGLLIQGLKVVPYCPRCGTPLSSHEVAQGYKEVKESSAIVRFKASKAKMPISWPGQRLPGRFLPTWRSA